MSAVESMVPNDGILLGLAAARKANRVLAGEPPGNIPSTTLDHFQFWVNMRTAEIIGIQIRLSSLIVVDRIVR